MSDGFGVGLTPSRYPDDVKTKGQFSYSSGVRNSTRLAIYVYYSLLMCFCSMGSSI